MLDHLVLATADLAGTAAGFAARSGVTPAPGGSHTGLGTANVLVGLGPTSYLEIVGPDPAQPEPAAPRPFGIDDLGDEPCLITWAVHPPDVDAVIAQARRAGYDPGEAQPMSRLTPDGEVLRWRLTPPGGLVPFLIDWGRTPHPSSRALPGLGLHSFMLEHPDPPQARAALDALGITVDLGAGPRPALVAVLDTPRGPLTLRT